MAKAKKLIKLSSSEAESFELKSIYRMRSKFGEQVKVQNFPPLLNFNFALERTKRRRWILQMIETFASNLNLAPKNVSRRILDDRYSIENVKQLLSRRPGADPPNTCKLVASHNSTLVTFCRIGSTAFRKHYQAVFSNWVSNEGPLIF